MKSFSFKQALILSTLALAGGAALAEDITMLDMASVSTRTRAEVQAEVLQALADGSLLGAGELPMLRATLPRGAVPLTRAQVRMQVEQGQSVVVAALYGAP